MRILWLALACACGLSAQSLTFSIHDNTGQTPDTPLPASYQFATTRVGDATTVMIAITNTSTTTSIVINNLIVGDSSGSATATPNFYITNNLSPNTTIAPGASRYINLNFTPIAVGQLSGYFQVEVNGQLQAVSTLKGTGLSPQFMLTYGAGTQLLPSQPSRLDFGAVSTSATASINFTLTNETTATLTTPSISIIPPGVFTPSAFAITASNVPATLAAGASGTFTVTFAPSQTSLTTATLQIGSNAYPIEGTGIVVGDIDALQISYVDSTGVRTNPQAATPIQFPQITPGGAASTLNFTVTNPSTSFNAITVSNVTATGAGFALTGLPAMPASIQPGGSITFSLSFNATSSGTYAGTLAIGTRSFSLSGLAVVSPVPAMSLRFSNSTLTSAQQATVTVEAATAAPSEQLGTLTMQFTPSVSGVNDDPAVVFLKTGGRTLSVAFAKGATTATYQGVSALTFQTGTTAGTLTFTLSFTNTPPVTQSFTITSAEIHISSATAQRQSPNLVVTVNGYDNTYSAGKMSFTFYDLKGKVINSTPLAVDSTTTFHDYFFTNNEAGGAFAMQATFPVTGDVSEIGSVAVTLENATGPTNTTLQFQ